MDDSASACTKPIWSLSVDQAMTELTKIKVALDSHAIVSITDRQGLITYVNDRFCAISGYKREELLGQKHSILKSGKHDDAQYRDLWRTITRGRVWHGVICNRRKNGGNYWVQSTIVPLSDETGQIKEFISVRTDITDRLLLQEHSSVLSQVLDLTEQCVAILNLNGTIIYINTALTFALGWDASEVQGRPFLEFVPSALHKRCLRQLSKIRTCDFKWQGQFSLLCRDGGIFTSSSHVGVVADIEGNPKYIFNIFSDFSEELSRRTALISAKQIAERANAAKSNFLSSISHELRTPLNAVLGFAKFLSMELTDSRHVRFSKEILFAGNHLLALLNEVLDLARIESGREVLNMELLDVGALTLECLSMMQPIAEIQKIRITLSIPDNHPIAVADRVRLKQVVLNLLSNAIKYSHEDGCVRLSLENIPSGRLKLSVMDHGRGIKPDQIDHLFEPFNRLEAQSLGIEGTGIGLVICKKLIEKMGGCIGVESIEGIGSIFWIELNAKSST